MKDKESKINVLLIKPMQEPQAVSILSDLETMQSLVGGLIEEIMPFDEEIAIICNEEGKLDGLVVNHPAMVAAREHGWTLFPDDYLVGNILLMDDSELEHNEE